MGDTAEVGCHFWVAFVPHPTAAAIAEEAEYLGIVLSII